jgi:uncharacterized phage protein gp47/JayE
MSAFVRPTLQELVTRIATDLRSRLEISGALLRRSMAMILARVIAGAAHMLHGHLDFLARQLFADQSEAAYLKRQASLFGITRTAATFATAAAGVTGTDGSEVPEGTLLVDAAGNEYETVGDVTIASGVGTLAVRSMLAGADYSLTEAQELTFQSPIDGVDAVATVDSDPVDGTDEETDDALRTRLLERMADPPMGGSDPDYIAWAKEVAGVTRVWVTDLELGAGTVVVRFVRDNDSGSNIPSGGEVTEVQTYLDTKRPAHATVTVVAPTDAPTAFTIAVEPDTTAVRDAVQAELEDLYSREAEPGATMLISAIRTAIGIAPGLTDYTLTVPSADVTHTTNQLPSVGAITWA